MIDVFAGIGGFSVGLERAGGFQTVAFCEQDEYANGILEKHWPGVARFLDVRELTSDTLKEQGIISDGDRICITGGFPCQDISFAGAGAGLQGERSGLWFELARLVRELEPEWLIVENVAALLNRGMGDLLGTLASLGYDAEWSCIPAVSVGAPHRRDRCWIVAYPNHDGCHMDTYQPESGSKLLHGNWRAAQREPEPARILDRIRRRLGGVWAVEPDVGRVADGIPNRVDRITRLGNAVVPTIPEIIGQAIMEYDNDRQAI